MRESDTACVSLQVELFIHVWKFQHDILEQSVLELLQSLILSLSPVKRNILLKELSEGGGQDSKTWNISAVVTEDSTEHFNLLYVGSWL
jgi:hypothetical protein